MSEKGTLFDDEFLKKLEYLNLVSNHMILRYDIIELCIIVDCELTGTTVEDYTTRPCHFVSTGIRTLANVIRLHARAID